MIKKIVLIILLISGVMWSQEEEPSKKVFEGYTNLTVAFRSNYFLGDNYMSKGHQNPNFGFSGKFNFFKFYGIGFGMGLNFGSIKVDDTTIGGNISKSNLSSYDFNFTYPIESGGKVSLEPTAFIGGFSIRQKTGSKDYGTHSGVHYGFGINFLYPLGKNIKAYSNIGYHLYNHKIRTSQEYQDYFKNSNALNLSLGIRFF